MVNDIDEMAEIPTSDEWRGIMVRARRERGLSQEALGRIVGTSQNVISLIEKGPPDGLGSSSFVQRICHALDIPLPQLHLDDDDKAWASLGRKLRATNLERFRAALRLVESIVPTDTESAMVAPSEGEAQVGPAKK